MISPASGAALLLTAVMGLSGCAGIKQWRADKADLRRHKKVMRKIDEDLRRLDEEALAFSYEHGKGARITRAKKRVARRRAAKKTLAANLVKIRRWETEGDAHRENDRSEDALTAYVAAVSLVPRWTETDFRLRKKVIGFVLGLKRDLNIPLEARRLARQAVQHIKDAEKPQDYYFAIGQFQKALVLAPWAANYYFNLAIVQKLTEDYGEGIENLRLYLIAEPEAADSEKVLKKIEEYGVAEDRLSGKFGVPAP